MYKSFFHSTPSSALFLDAHPMAVFLRGWRAKEFHIEQGVQVKKKLSLHSAFRVFSNWDTGSEVHEEISADRCRYDDAARI